MGISSRVTNTVYTWQLEPDLMKTIYITGDRRTWPYSIYKNYTIIIIYEGEHTLSSINFG